MKTARRIANQRMGLPHIHSAGQCNQAVCPGEPCGQSGCTATREYHWDGIGPRPALRPIRLHAFVETADDKTPAVATDELWSMALDRARLQTQWDAAQTAIRNAKNLMRQAFDKCPVEQAGARDVLFAKAYSMLGQIGGLV